MNKYLPFLGLGVVLIAIIAGLYLFFQGPPVSGQYDEFAQCLSDKGVKMYGAWWCPHCATQKEWFGPSFKYVNYIECSTPDGNAQLQVCRDAGIEGYPTWEFQDGSRRSGEIPLDQLSLYSGCPLQPAA